MRFPGSGPSPSTEAALQPSPSREGLGGDGFPPGPTETHPHPGPPGPAQRAGRSAGLRGSAAQAGHPHPLEGEGEMLEGKGEQLGLRRHALVAIGGGKDSLVSIEALRKVGVEQTVTWIGGSQLIRACPERTGLPTPTLGPPLAPDLFATNARGGWNRPAAGRAGKEW